MPSARIRRIAALIACAQLVLLDISWAKPGAQCRAVRVGQRVLIRVSLTDFVDRDFVRLVRAGLQGRVRVSATLIRRRRNWFDATVASRTVDLPLRYRRRRGFVLGDRKPVRNPARIDTGTLSIGVGIRSARGLYVVVSAKLRVVTTKSLRRTADWITGGDRAGPGVVKDRVIEMVVSDLTRSASASCIVTER